MIAKYTPRILEIYPDLDINSISHNGEGLINEVFIVNNETVFRFAKNEDGLKVLQTEIQILDLIRPHVRLNIPNPFYVGQDVIAYQLLAGETMSRHILVSLSDSDQQAVADQLADFLRVLHTIPMAESVPPTSAPVKYETWLTIRQEVEEKIYPLLMAHQIDWATQLFERMLSDRSNFDYQPCLIHGDLGPYHLLFDAGTNRLTGLIDFGVAGLGDPATDVGNLLQVYGESFVSRLQRQYPELELLLKRARFYAQALELQWVLAGLKSGESFWFSAHLGGARDIRV